jgi:hypothetical protein
MKKAVLVLAGLLAALVGLRFFVRDPLAYFLHFDAEQFADYWPRRWWLVFHIAGGSLALLAGPFQFWTGLRRRRLEVHRWTGRLYLAGVLIGGIGSFYLVFFTTPPDFALALFGLATAWWTTSGMALASILRGQVDAHRDWMIRSYVVTYGFVNFRWLFDWQALAAFGDARAATAGWLCWSVPLLFAEVAIQWRRSLGPVPVR